MSRQEVVAPKERRRRARAGKAAKAPARKPRTPEERHADRVAERRKKAGAPPRRARPGAGEGRRERRRRADDARRASTGRGGRRRARASSYSDKADKTITVRIDIARRHRRYEKIVRTSNTLHAHDESNDAHVGDTVIVRESPPAVADQALAPDRSRRAGE